MSLEPEATEAYVIRKIKKVHKGGHHGGSWKIAYADFVTAMMAFFLLMWLLGLMNKHQLEGFSNYFNRPLNTVYQKNEHNSERVQDNLVKKEAPKLLVAKKLSNTEMEAMMMKQRIENDLKASAEMQPYKDMFDFVVTADGLKIVLKELQNKPMFSTGKTDFEVYAKSILSWLTKEINQYHNDIEIIGHTDAAQFHGEENYTNWELSADRANATRRELIKNGMHDQKILRVIGIGDKDLLQKANGLDPSNRRIEIVVLSNEAVNRIVD